MSVKENMPIIASNEGVWEGWYRYYNLEGEKTDEHRSRLLCRFLDEETYHCLLYTSPSPRDKRQSRMPSSA